MKKLLLVLVIIALAGAYVVFFMGNPSGGGKKVRVAVPRGTTVEMLADTLYTKGLIRSKVTFDLAARATKLSKSLLAGLFEITPGGSNLLIANQFKGTTNMVELQVTIPEGSTMYRIAELVAKTFGLDSSKFIAAASDRSFLDSLKVPAEAENAEGYLFPDTYTFLTDPSSRDIITTMVHKWKKVLTDTVIAAIRQQGWTLHRFMTFASIVESEAQRPEERDTIAGVYANRIRIGMKLDADPTVQYGLHLSRPITHDDLLINNPYNTYLNPGLPPGPVNNPGRAAIEAALHPVKHKLLYFVARRDGTGGHYFSESMDGQNANINRARQNAAAAQ